jgi:hypothetical protein
MTWMVVFLGLVVLVITIYLATRIWPGLRELQRSERQRQFLDTMREASADAHDPPEGDQHA